MTDPTKLIPELPSPNDLKPFPTQVSIDFVFHRSTVRSIAISPNGLWLASGDEDHNVVIWNARTGHPVRKYRMPFKVVDAVEWCPNTDYCLLAVANESEVHLIGPELYRKDVTRFTRELFDEAASTYKIEAAASDKKEHYCKWVFHMSRAKAAAAEEDKDGETEKRDYHKHIIASIVFKNVISRISWHVKGDYLATMAHNIQSTSQVLIHSVSHASS